jgi:hypothetical protein
LDRFNKIFYFYFSAIKLEEDHLKFVTGIESFDKDKLAKTPTVEKNTLPTKEVIDQEKTAE